MNVLNVSLSWRRASAAIVSNTMEDFPDPDTPVKMVILRFGMRKDTFFRLFSRAANLNIFLRVILGHGFLRLNVTE